MIAFVAIVLSYVGSLFAFISPSSDLRWESSVDTLLPSYSKGDTVPITGLLEEGTQYIENGEYFVFTTSENVMWTVLILVQTMYPYTLREEHSVA